MTYKKYKISKVVLFIAIVFILFLVVAVLIQLNTSENICWKFAVLCDTRNDDYNKNNGRSGINETFIKNLSAEVAQQNCDLVLVPGDMINGWLDNGTPISASYVYYKNQLDNWTKAMGPVYNNSIRTYTVRGNHEDGPSANFSSRTKTSIPPHTNNRDPELLRAYNVTLGIKNPHNGPPGEENLTYSFPYKNAFFIGLDEYANPHRVNQEWLDDQLKWNTKPFVFVFGHEPAFQISHPDCLAYHFTDRCKFWNTIGRAGCQIYFCGHDHLYDRVHIPDSSGNVIYQMVVGSCGAPMKKWKPPYEDCSVIGDFHNNNRSGYVLVTMRCNNTALVEWRAWNASDSKWTTLDRFSLRGKENMWIHWIPWTTIILLGWPIAICSLLIWRSKRDEDSSKDSSSVDHTAKQQPTLAESDEDGRYDIWEELMKSFAKGDDCGKFEDLVTALIIWIAIPGVMAACWYLFPMYHEQGMISAQDAIPDIPGMKENMLGVGVTLFVAVYFVAQTIERIIEFFSNIPIFKDSMNKMAKLKTKIDQVDLKINERLKAYPHADIRDEKKELEELMDKQNCLETSRRSRLLAAASGLGIIFSYFFIGLFALVGIDSIPHWIDALITGIILGGGSKPLHDLITSIERKT